MGGAVSDASLLSSRNSFPAFEKFILLTPDTIEEARFGLFGFVNDGDPQPKIVSFLFFVFLRNYCPSGCTSIVV